jgi:hypothetical protein
MIKIIISLVYVVAFFFLGVFLVLGPLVQLRDGGPGTGFMPDEKTPFPAAETKIKA